LNSVVGIDVDPFVKSNIVKLLITKGRVEWSGDDDGNCIHFTD